MVLDTKKVLQGMGLALEAATFAANHRRVQKRFLKVLKVTVIGMAIAYGIIYALVFLPLLLLRAGNSVLATLLQYDAAQTTLALLSTRDAVDHFLGTLPLLGLDLITHIRPSLFSEIFFTMLDEVDPEYARALRTWPPKKFRWAKIKFAVQRLARRYAMMLVASYLSRTPLVGWLVMPIGSLMMMARFVGYPVASAIAFLSVVAPGSKHSAVFFFKSLLAMNDFSGDLLKPYFTQMGAKPKQQVAFYKQYESSIVGFILSFYFFVQLSWVGPAFYILAQAAIALFISRMTPRPPEYTAGVVWEKVYGNAKEE
ncbi:hypothetical protein IW140_002611 [Coemansia sp. RSA 1813]|nr:hypothetical protein EV178_002061 [Coemansia sp. RSA 1646]KAJ1772690.1 hypothetical protein LPJ74_001216 [Coemansia sp. RSA 1843]KAJ2090641.1 hypothetical protein IW138_002455 [Coemansia sp. RSA 986]KAJ2216154.1 hypothetical protein EV179_001614 [Coemansia sp. RSA 487]KAJ2570141.1 hypothetical protein IW140_002611 [Coemansia sp. RSA 1813]